MAQNASGARLVVHAQVANHVDDRVFGQFLERASFGEPGPEPFADPNTGALPKAMVDMLKQMNIPVIRFPGGTDIDYIDWTDMLDRVPGRTNDGREVAFGRPVTVGHSGGRITNRFGHDEYFALRDELGCQTILVLNVLDGLAKRKPVDDAALHAVGLIAYANAPQGAELPEGMPDWPAVRAANGHAEPFGAQYVQIGNEIFLSRVAEAVKDATGLTDEQALADWYIEVYSAYIKAIRQADPNIEIIIDANLGHSGAMSQKVLADPYINANVTYAARHTYAPGPCDQVKRDGREVDPSTLTSDQWWWAWVAMPGHFGDDGTNGGFGPPLDELHHAGYMVAGTEWNWNGWRWQGFTSEFDATAAAGLGAAGFIQGMMRQGDVLVMANQSNLLGCGWEIAAIQGDRELKAPPYFNPQGTAITFYNHHHGNQRLKCDVQNVAARDQPFAIGWAPARPKVAELDVVVTRNDSAVFIHAINRNFDDDVPLEIDLTELGAVAPTGTHHTFTCKLHAEKGHGITRGMAQTSSQPFEAANKMTVTLPKRSASIFEFALAGR